MQFSIEISQCLQVHIPPLPVQQCARRPVNSLFDTGPLFGCSLIGSWLNKEQPMVSRDKVAEIKAPGKPFRLIVSGLCGR